MKKQKNNDAAAAKKLLDLYNMLANLFWSALSLVPLTIFCYRFVPTQYLIVFLIPVLASLFLPKRFFNKLQLSGKASLYKSLGVGLVNKVSQNGVIVQRLVKKRFHGYKAVTYHRSSLNRLLRQTYMYEKFHFAAAVFFVLLTLHAFSEGLFGWVIFLVVTNLVYNIYPILFQQYVRLKLKTFPEKEKSQNARANVPNSCQKFLHRFG